MEVNLINLIERYSDESKCRQYLEALKWQEGVKCPRCGSEKISHIVKRHQYDCDECRYQFTVTAGYDLPRFSLAFVEMVSCCLSHD